MSPELWRVPLLAGGESGLCCCFPRNLEVKDWHSTSLLSLFYFPVVLYKGVEIATWPDKFGRVFVEMTTF